MIQIKDLIKEIKIKFSYIPDFIDTKNENHKLLWSHINNTTDVFLILITDEVMKKESIRKILELFKKEFYILLDIDRNLSNEVIYYITINLQLILDMCVEEERYEAAQNIQLFLENLKIDIKNF